MNQVHLKEREHIRSPASFKGDLWRYIAFNPNTDLVALWTVDIQRDICVIPFSNESLFPSPQFPSFSRLLTRALDWETDRTGNISSDVYTLLAQAKGLWTIGFWWRPSPPSLFIEPSDQLASVCFKTLTEHLQAGLFSWARTSTWLDPPQHLGGEEPIQAPGGMWKGMVKRALPNYVKFGGCRCKYFPFQIPDLHLSFPSTVWFGSFFCDFSYIRLQCHIFIMQQLSTACWFSGTDCFLMTV